MADGKRGEAFVQKDGRVVHQNIQPPELGFEKDGELFGGVLLGYVERMKTDVMAVSLELPAGGLSPLRAAGRENDEDPLLRQPSADGEANPFVSPRNDGDFLLRHRTVPRIPALSAFTAL